MTRSEILSWSHGDSVNLWAENDIKHLMLMLGNRLNKFCPEDMYIVSSQTDADIEVRFDCVNIRTMSTGTVITVQWPERMRLKHVETMTYIPK
jgi:hypothetical protein